MKNALRLIVLLLLCFPVHAGAAPMLAQDNPVGDPGFEGDLDKDTGIPKSWQPFSSREHNFRIITGVGHMGAKSIRMSAQKTPQAHLGIFQSIPVEPRKRYTLTAWALNDPQDKLAGSSRFVISLEFVDAGGQEIGRFSSRPEGVGLSKIKWQQIKASGKAPPYSAFVKVVICLQDGDGRGEGAVLVDDVELRIN